MSIQLPSRISANDREWNCSAEMGVIAGDWEDCSCADSFALVSADGPAGTVWQGIHRRPGPFGPKMSSSVIQVGPGLGCDGAGVGGFRLLFALFLRGMELGQFGRGRLWHLLFDPGVRVQRTR